MALAVAASLLAPAAAWAAPDCTDLVPSGAKLPARNLVPEDLVRLRDIGPVDPNQQDEGLFSVSPDGRHAAFQLRRGDPATNGFCLAMLVVDLGTGAVRVVDRGGDFIRLRFDARGVASFPSGFADPITPRWSPDGKWIVYRRRDRGAVQLWRAWADGSGSEAVTDSVDDVDDFRVTADGLGLVYATQPGLRDALATIDKEGLSGLHYDDRFVPAASNRPFPSLSRPGILDALNHQDFGYRWVTRFISLDKTDATRALTRLRRQWFNKRKSVTAMLREVIYNQPVQLFDSDADNKTADADLALQALGGDHVAFGHLTTTITVADEDRARVEEKVRAVERIVNGLGFTCIREGLNAVEAWLSGLPGQVYANVRQPLVHTLNLAHLMPLSSVWAGPARNRYLDGPPLLYAETSGSTPFRLSTHVGDVGHMMIVGPTGAGKSVLLALIALQFRRYPDNQLYIFDMGRSARAATLAMGGAHHGLGLGGDAGETIAFQPLAGIDDAGERAWAAEWIAALLAHEKVVVTPEVKEAVWSALTSLASAPPEERTLTGLSLLLQSTALRSALAPYTLEGPFGRLLDAAEDDLCMADVQCFETEALMGAGSVVAPVLTYLFHRLEARFTGRPTLLILDEAWKFLDHPLFAARIREWLKTLRKKNVAVFFASQSLADVADSGIAPAIIESCPQRILLPNAAAIEPQGRAAYQRFGLNDRQVELVSRATPKRHYYLQSSAGNRLFELGLGPIALALCGASDPSTQARIDALLAEHGPSNFAARFLEDAGLDWAAALLAQFPGPQAKE